MENSLFILIALFLGYGQGIRSLRKRERKAGGIGRHIKEKFSRKWELIREQDEEIFKLKDEIIQLTRKNQNKKENGCYTKGNINDFKKSFLFFIWEDMEKIEAAIKYSFLLTFLLEPLQSLQEEKYTENSWKEMILKIEAVHFSPETNFHHNIGDINYVFDYEEIMSGAKKTIKDFDDFNYDITYGEIKNCLNNILEKIVVRQG